MRHKYVPPNDQSNHQVVQRVAYQRGLGEKGFSATLKMSIREWQEFQLQDPAHMTIEDIQRVLIDLGLIDQSLHKKICGRGGLEPTTSRTGVQVLGGHK